MRIVCPTCTAAYDVPDGVVSARRTMRCARCSTDFTARAAPPGQAIAETAPPPTTPPQAAATLVAAPSAPVIEPKVQPDDRQVASADAATQRTSTPRKIAVLAAWCVTLALLSAGAWAFVTQRQPIMHAWPAASRIYAVLGYTR